MKIKHKYIILAVCLCCLVVLAAYGYLNSSISGRSIDNSQVADQDISKAVAGSQPAGSEQKILSIHGCIGCGRCARIDSEHFSMSGRHAAVISSENLDSSALAQAIESCPAGAISL